MALRQTLKNALSPFYEQFIPSYEAELRNAVAGCKSLLDVGCGSSSPIKAFSKSLYCVGVDLHEPSIADSRRQGIHNVCYVMDVLDIDRRFKENSFDCVLALGVIEHLNKEAGVKLLEKMEKIAKKKVIIMMPNGFVPQGVHFDNPLQVHKSGWSVQEMRRYGYAVTGLSGWKPLRGEAGNIKYRPYTLWAGISLLSKPFVRTMPVHAFELLCIKQLERDHQQRSE